MGTGKSRPSTVSSLDGYESPKGFVPPRPHLVDSKEEGIQKEPDVIDTNKKQEERSERNDANKEDSSTPGATPSKQIMERTSSKSAKDLMISYSHKDKVMMQKLKDNLEENGITVWVDTGLAPGADFLRVIGSAIINAKIFIPLLSSDSVTSKWCKDEVALAFISKGTIFPVALQDRKHLHSLMETDMKVELDTFKWTFILDPDQFDSVFQNLVKKIKAEIKMIENLWESEKAQSEEKPAQRAPMLRSKTNINLMGNYADAEEDPLLNIDPEEYWQDRFSGEEVDFRKFFSTFQRDYKDKIEEIYSKDDQKLMEDVFIREMEIDNDDVLYKEKYLFFCRSEGKLSPLWERLQEELLQSLAMRKVFDTDSYYRVQAIDNLGSFKGSAVIEALRDLLVDKKPNVRAVATVSLAKTGVKDKLTIRRVLKCLSDKDRLVRQAGCLALGHMKAEVAVPQLLELWRNDIISSVRAAAEAALKQIGGPAVEKDMQFTDMLEREIEELKAAQEE